MWLYGRFMFALTCLLIRDTERWDKRRGKRSDGLLSSETTHGWCDAPVLKERKLFCCCCFQGWLPGHKQFYFSSFLKLTVTCCTWDVCEQPSWVISWVYLSWTHKERGEKWQRGLLHISFTLFHILNGQKLLHDTSFSVEVSHYECIVIVFLIVQLSCLCWIWSSKRGTDGLYLSVS